MSFDPQNPRGAPRPPTPPPSTPNPANYIPPQPVNRGPSTALIAAVVVIVILLLGIVVLLVLNGLKSGPSNSPAPTSSASAYLASPAAPTAAVSPRGSSVPSIVPPTPIGSLPAGFEEFLAHVPEALRASCLPTDNSDPAVTAGATCTTTDGIAVTYAQYPDTASMDAAYQAVFADQEIDPDTGSCEDHGTWPAEGSYEVENAPAGRRLCVDVQGSPTIYWTDERLNFYSSATGPDPVRLIQFWTNEAGPIQ